VEFSEKIENLSHQLNNTPKRVLITGVSGYLGSHLAKTMNQAGWTVHGLDNKHSFNNYVDVMHAGDVRDGPRVESVLGNWRFDLVIHLAARIEAGISVLEPTEFYDVNVGGTCAVVNAMNKHGVKNIIYSSTAAVYKTKNTIIKEDDEIEFNQPYGHSKELSEQIINKSGLNYVIFRFFNLTGADEDGEFGEDHQPETHLIPRLIFSLGDKKYERSDIEFVLNGDDYNTKDGTCIRDYVHVNDVTDAHILAWNYLNRGGKSDVFNLGTGQGHSVYEILSEVEKVSEKLITIKLNDRRDGDAESLVADISKAVEILKYKPKYNITSIIKTAYEWHTNDKQKS
jgi:UDP-glucose 4-epimerase